MTYFAVTEYNSYLVYTPSAPINTAEFMVRFLRAEMKEATGRGKIKLFPYNGKEIACRKYLHGGLFRAITGDLFVNARRALNELDILLFLENKGVSVVHPVAVIATKHPFLKNLYLATEYVEDSVNLTEYLMASGKIARFRTIRKLVELFLDLRREGVFHRDLHLNNILISGEGKLILLDFDRARRKEITEGDIKYMFLRLYRNALKIQRKGAFSFDIREAVFFLRTYKKLSGIDIISLITGGLKRRVSLYRIGWYMEKLLYGGGK